MMGRLTEWERQGGSRQAVWQIEQGVHRSHDEVVGVVGVLPRRQIVVMNLRRIVLDLWCADSGAGSCA